MTSVKSYYETDLNDDQTYFENVVSNAITTFAKKFMNNENANNESENIDENTPAVRIKHGRSRIVKYSARINQIVLHVCFFFDGINIFQSSSQFQAFQLKKIMKLFKKKDH